MKTQEFLIASARPHRRHSDHVTFNLHALLAVAAVVTWTMLGFVVYEVVTTTTPHVVSSKAG